MDAQAYNQVLHGVYSTGHTEMCAHGKHLNRASRYMWGNYSRIVVTGGLVGVKIHYMHVLHAYIFQAKLTYEK